ncbi:MAG: PEP-CTERM sorting domain-containing protein [Heteroscytonema crispum UTEX LB 1556]
MGANINKIGIYTSIVVAIGAIATAPAQATSLQNFTSDTNNFDGNNQDKTDTSNLITTNDLTKDQLLQEAKRNVEQITEASNFTQNTVDGTTYYIYNSPPSQDDTTDPGNKQPQTSIYTNTWKSAEPAPRRKIPEPSALLGLIAISGWLTIQRLKKKTAIDAQPSEK